MIQYKPVTSRLTEDDLPETDNQPVDNELQVLIPTLLRAILALLWAERMDWFLGVNLGVYPDPDLPAIGPDAFLSLGVVRYKQDSGRLSYVVPQENNIMPQWVLEVVSKTPGGEYGEKMAQYAALGVLYYTVYNPTYGQRDRHEPFEVYRLENGSYVRQAGNPVWLPEVGLGIGCEVGSHEGLERVWLYWYDEGGDRHPAPENVIEQERQLRQALEQQLQQTEQQLEQTEQQLEQTEQQLEQEQQLRSRAEQAALQERRLREELLERLRQQGIDVDGL